MEEVKGKGFEDCLRFLKVYKGLDGCVESVSVKPVFRFGDDRILKVNVRLSGDVEIEGSVSKRLLEKIINYMKAQIGILKNDDLVVGDVVYRLQVDKKMIKKKELLLGVSLEEEKVMVGRFPPVSKPYICVFGEVDYDLAGVVLKAKDDDLLDSFVRKEDIEKMLKEFIKMWMVADPEVCEEFLRR
jgi:hypothetical protein